MKKYNVRSEHQSGGITAGEVHVHASSPPRRATQDLARQLCAAIPQDRPIRISVPLNDGEAYQFGDQLRTALRMRGYVVEEGIPQVVRTPPISHDVLIDLETEPATTLLKVGGQRRG